MKIQIRTLPFVDGIRGSRFGRYHMTRMLAAALTMLALTGCAVSSSTATTNGSDMAADTCRSFGHTPGTEAFASCAQAEMTSMRADTMNFYKETMNCVTDAYANSQNKPSDANSQSKPSEQAAEAVPERSEAIAADQMMDSRVLASRLFAAPHQYPPEEFAAYGILAFGSRASPHDRARHLMICEAYIAGLPHSSELTGPRSSELTVPLSDQMVTVWPVDLASTSNRLNRMAQNGLCKIAVERYGLTTARAALLDAGVDTVGIGPFLLAWSPSTDKGKPGALVLVADLSDVTTYLQAQEFLLAWSHDIERDPLLWRNGWSLEKVRLKVRLWADAYGAKILAFVGKQG